VSLGALPDRHRRALLEALAAVAMVAPGAAAARDYAGAGAVLDEIDRLSLEVDARLRGLAVEVPGARAFAASVAAVHAAHHAERAALRRRLGLGAGHGSVPSAADRDLAGLRAAVQDLVHAHAEGLPALRDARAVDLLARHMVEDARHLTVVDLWVEAEAHRE
jgi:hypothetical protein